MKSKLYTLAMALLSLLFTAHGEPDITQIWNDPVPLLNEIRLQINNKDRNPEENAALAADIQTLAYAINQEIIAAESPDWGTPSAERKAVIRKWGDNLNPYTEELVDLALSTQTRYTDSGKQARSLLDFAPPTEEFAEQVRKYLRKGEGGADMLFEHRLLSEADVEVMKNLAESFENEEAKFRYVLSLKAVSISDFDSYLLSKAKSIFGSNPEGNTPEEIIKHFGPALSVAGVLGKDASSLLPYIQAVMKRPEIISSGYFSHFEYICDLVTERQPRQVRYAINGSGPLSPWLESESLEKPKSEVPVSKPSPELRSPTEQEPKLVTETEESPQPTRWPVLVAVIVAAFSLLWVLLKKRK